MKEKRKTPINKTPKNNPLGGKYRIYWIYGVIALIFLVPSLFPSDFSLENMEYNTFMKDHLVFNVLAPYTSDLNFNIKMLTGASNVSNSIWNQEGYHQHIFEIGGKGTLRGYNWKQFYSSHYFLSTIEIWFDEFGILYDRAVMFESPGNQFGLDYLDDLSKNFTSNIKHSAGISIGDEDVSLSFIRTLDDDPTTIIYLTLGTPIQY